MSGLSSHPTPPARPTQPTAPAVGASAPAAQSAAPAGDRPAGGPAAYPPSGRRRGISRQSKIVLVGAAVALLAIVVITVATTASKAAPPRTPPAAKAFTLSLLGHPGQHSTRYGTGQRCSRARRAGSRTRSPQRSRGRKP